MLKIGIDGSRAFIPNKTGTGWYSFYLLKSLQSISKKRRDLKFILYVNQPSYLLEQEKRDMPDNWEVRFLSWPVKLLWTQIRLSWEMKKSPVDILFVPAHSLPPVHPKFSVLTIHDLGFERFPNFYSLQERLLLCFSYRLGSRWAKKIIVPSEFTKKELIHFYNIAPQKIIVIPLGYDKEIFQRQGNLFEGEKDKEVLRRYNLYSPYFLYIGRISKKKNISLLISAYRKFARRNPNFKLVLIGPDKEKKNYFPKELKTHIVKIPYLSHQDIASFYRQAQAFIFPSFYEGFGLPLLEAMACGTPVIASRIPPFQEIGKNAPLYFNPNSSYDLFLCLKRISRDNYLRKKMACQGFEITKNYSWEKCAKQTLKTLTTYGGQSPKIDCSNTA